MRRDIRVLRGYWDNMSIDILHATMESNNFDTAMIQLFVRYSLTYL